MTCRIREFLVIALLLTGAPALAQSAQIREITATGVGVLALENTKQIKDAAISTGARTDSQNPELLTATTTVTGSTDLNFGMIFVASGTPKNGIAAIRVKWLYPAPGMINPGTGVAKMLDEYPTTIKLGEPTHLGWEVRRDWQIVSGIWTLQIWTANGQRMLASQDFTMVKP
jgi:hypothetical protein